MGHARTISRESKDPSKQRTSKHEVPKSPRIGARAYAAPEMILGNTNYDYGADIWSIGCIVGELLLTFIEDHKVEEIGDSLSGSDDMKTEFKKMTQLFSRSTEN